MVKTDPGAKHNFISLKPVEKLKVQVSSSGRFVVSLGNGEAVRGIGLCKQVKLILMKLWKWEDFLHQELGNSDVILDIQWLEKLGSVVTNLKTQVLLFYFTERRKQ